VVSIKLAVYLGEEKHKIGPGKVRLLEAIEECGSISAAARSMGMAYRHAWAFVDELNRCFTNPVVAVSIGGRDGGGAKLTPWGRELIERFHSMEKATRRAISRNLDSLLDSVAPAAPPARRRAVATSSKVARAGRRRRQA